VKATALRVGDAWGHGRRRRVDIPAEVTEAAMQRLEQEAGLSREQVYLSATHTIEHRGWGEAGR